MEIMDGFACISNRIKEFYPEQKGLYYATLISGYLGGNDPLDGVEIWKSDKCCPHWLYVTYGFTDLYVDEEDYENEEDCAGSADKDIDNCRDGFEDDAISGYGFELTFRLKRGNEDQPPVWPVNMLQNLARYVFSTGNTFASGHYLNANGPIALETDTKLTCLGFLTDPELGSIQTVNGSMTFLEAIGITLDEHAAMMCWNGQNFLNELNKYIPYGIADLSRTTLMELPAFRSAWEQGVARDGSSTSVLYLPELTADQKNSRCCLQFGAGHVEQVVTLLRARVEKDRPFILQCDTTVIEFRHAEQPDIHMDDEVLCISLTSKNLNEICQLVRPHTGTYCMDTIPLTIGIVPTYIRDNNGNIIETVE